MASSAEYPFLKGHGTENDFVILPDADGAIHGELSAKRVRALCDRHAGIGGDGVLRVIRTEHLDPDLLTSKPEAVWFMDYRNADGSIAEMCGNGVRVFARYLVVAGLATPTQRQIAIATRAGVKTATFASEDYQSADITVDLGMPRIEAQTEVAVADGAGPWPATHVDMGNPHAVAFVADLADAGSLLAAPQYDQNTYPDGVNVEFVTRCGEAHVAMRVHERGSGETRSCGTGAGAVGVAWALADAAAEPGSAPSADTTYRVDVPGGTVWVTWTTNNHVLLTGPAVLVAAGTTALGHP